MCYNKETLQKWLILETWKSPNNELFVITRNPKRCNNQFAWGSYYDIRIGQWSHGHYDFENLDEARRDLLNRYMNSKKLILIKE